MIAPLAVAVTLTSYSSQAQPLSFILRPFDFDMDAWIMVLILVLSLKSLFLLGVYFLFLRSWWVPMALVTLLLLIGLWKGWRYTNRFKSCRE